MDNKPIIGLYIHHTGMDNKHITGCWIYPITPMDNRFIYPITACGGYINLLLAVMDI